MIIERDYDAVCYHCGKKLIDIHKEEGAVSKHSHIVINEDGILVVVCNKCKNLYKRSSRKIHTFR